MDNSGGKSSLDWTQYIFHTRNKISSPHKVPNSRENDRAAVVSPKTSFVKDESMGCRNDLRKLDRKLNVTDRPTHTDSTDQLKVLTIECDEPTSFLNRAGEFTMTNLQFDVLTACDEARRIY